MTILQVCSAHHVADPGISFGGSCNLGLTHLSTANPIREDFAKQIYIGGGRKMYLECRGSGSPTVVLVAGLKGSAGDWNVAKPSGPTVFAEVAKFTRVCAYDRPGTPVGEKPSRSDPVPQATTAREAVADLHALLSAAGVAGPYVLVGHSYGGLIVRLYASIYPEDVSGLVLVDALTEGLRDAETPEQWAIQRKLMEGDIRESSVRTRTLKGTTQTAASTRSAPPRHCAHSPWSCCLRTGPGDHKSRQ